MVRSVSQLVLCYRISSIKRPQDFNFEARRGAYRRVALIGGWRLIERGAYFKVGKIVGIKFQNFAIVSFKTTMDYAHNDNYQRRYGMRFSSYYM